MNINYKEGYVNRGNTAKIKAVMNRAAKGEDITVAFLGGSITQGFLAEPLEKNCYAVRTYRYFCEKFPESNVTYVNAGIGGTTSHYGVSRVEKDVLSKNPDLVFVEFSVNDENTEFFKETYEGLIRRILKAPCEPAVFLIHNVFYKDGSSAEEIHREIGTHYALPSVSMKNTVYDEILKGQFTSKDVTKDDLHPNNEGHEIIRNMIVNALEEIYENRQDGEELPSKELPASLTKNAYEKAIRYQNDDIKPELTGFIVDLREKEEYHDIFSKGFLGKNIGDTISFVVHGSEIAAQYRKTPKKPAPVAEAIVDGDEEHAVILDGNFDEDWGDSLTITNLLFHGEKKEHSVTIRIKEATKEDISDFYLVSLIVSEE